MRSLALLALLAVTAHAEPQSFLREDWVYEDDVKHPDQFGINHWGLKSFPLPFRAAQRGKHALENKYADNFRAHPVVGVPLRFLSTMVDFGLMSGLQNFDHVLGHDSRGREFARDYPGSTSFVSRRFSATLPVFLGGKELNDTERQTSSHFGPDNSALINSTLWEMRNQFVYDLERTALAADAVNRAELANLIFHRLSLIQMQWEEPIPACVAAYGQNNQPGVCRGGSGEARDWSNYVMDLNTGRYGVTNADQYRVKISDLKRANLLALGDPIFLTSVWRYGADYVVNGKLQTHLPMLPLFGGLSYLPGYRINLSPFGIDYIQDNFFRYRTTLVNIFWTRGDNKYERRLGLGFDADGIPLYKEATWGAFGELYKQPTINSIDRPGPVGTANYGVVHNAWNAGLSLHTPIYDLKEGRRVLLTLKVGRKSSGWIPGEYIKRNTYVDVGLGLRL